MPSVIEFYQQLKILAKQANHRQLCCLQGSTAWCFQQATNIILHEEIDYQWCGEAPSSISTTHYNALLGQDVQLLILNMSDQFNANMFAAAEGSACGGSVILLLLPETSTETDRFSIYIKQHLVFHQFPFLIENHPIQLQNIDKTKTVNHQLYIDEQQQAIQQIIKTVNGHRRRPLVITANRGRGKSSALGIAAATLINQGLTKILVCAPNKQSVATLYKHAKLTLTNPDDLHLIQFIAPDALYIEQTTCDLLIIDEAAAIPIKLLTEFTKRYSRLVFATTQFGYEGSGRGFALRFQQQLNSLAPGWRALNLSHPIRWAENDPVEAFTLSSLCLQENKSEFNLAGHALQPIIKVISTEELLNNPLQLNQLFSLLVNAHYQTQPSDLANLLNDQHLTIITMQHGLQILAVALINHEGAFDQTMSEQVYQGKRRPQGHLIAQSLTFHSGFEHAAMQTYARIQRIAVQPSLQNQSFGSQLLSWVINWAKQQSFDHLSASFAASDNLLRFWLRHQLQVLRIGGRKDKSSGQHSFMVNLPLSGQGKILHKLIHTDFKKQIKVQLARQLTQLDSLLLITLWPQIATPNPDLCVQNSLSAYINANRGYENVEYLLIELLYSSPLESLNSKQQRCMIEKIIQNHSWQQLVEQHGFTGQKQAQAFLKNCICDLLMQQQREHTS